MTGREEALRAGIKRLQVKWGRVRESESEFRKGRAFNLIVSKGQKKNSGRESHQVGPHDGVNQNTGIRKHKALERGRESEGERYGHVSALSCAACKQV